MPTRARLFTSSGQHTQYLKSDIFAHACRHDRARSRPNAHRFWGSRPTEPPRMAIAGRLARPHCPLPGPRPAIRPARGAPPNRRLKPGGYIDKAFAGRQCGACARLPGTGLDASGVETARDRLHAPASPGRPEGGACGQAPREAPGGSGAQRVRRMLPRNALGR